MTYDFETTPVDGYLRFTASGTIESAEEAMAYLKAILTSAQKANCLRVLVDERNVSKNLDMYDCVVSADRWTSDHPPSGIRVAAVYSPAEAQEFHWIETILNNRSVVCRIFDDMDEARKWLMP